jgi:ATP-dependent Clp endopeptidase proteolytic subunit ClpP
MVALVPTEADAARLATEGGLPAGELHLTLLFLGDADDWDDDARTALVEAMRGLERSGVVNGDAFALSVFNPGTDERDTCIVLGVGGTAVDDAHTAAVGAAPPDSLPEQHQPWAAHVSLIYTDDLSKLAELVDRTGPIVFDRIRVAFADTVTDIPLASQADDAAPEARVNPFLRNPSAYKRTPIRAELPTAKSGPAGVVTLRLYDPIDDWGADWGVSAKEFAAVLDALPDDTREIRLLINSPGGNVWDGLAILNTLRSHPARFVAVVEGIAASAASFIAAGADELTMMPNARLMIHRAWGGCIGNAVDMEKMSADLAGEDQNLASIYAAKAGGTAEEWLARMTSETFISADEAVELGLADRIVEPPPGAKDAVAEAKARFDLSVFQNRASMPGSPAGSAPTADPPTHPAAPGAVTELPAAEPEPTTEKEEDPVSDDLSEVSSRLGLADDADMVAILAAVDALKAQAETPAEPVAAVETEAVKQEADELRKEVSVLASTVQSMSAKLAASEAEKAAGIKASVLDEAQRLGKFAPADRATWEADYDEAPGAITRLLNRIEPGTAVPIRAKGEVGDAEPDVDQARIAEIDSIFSVKPKGN